MKKARCTVFGPVLLVLVFLFSACQAPGGLFEETKEYVWPVELINLSGLSAQRTKDSIDNSPERLSEEVIVNDDGSVTIRCTESQRIKWVENAEAFVDEKLDYFKEKNGFEIVVAETMDDVQIRLNPDTTHPLSFSAALQFFVSKCYIYQIFSDIPPDDCLVHYSIINEKTENVVGAETFPGGEFQLNPEDWK